MTRCSCTLSVVWLVCRTTTGNKQYSEWLADSTKLLVNKGVPDDLDPSNTSPAVKRIRYSTLKLPCVATCTWRCYV